MKKLLLGLGTIAAVVAPVAAVVACGTSDAKPTNPNPTNTGPGKTGPTNTGPTNTGNPVVPATNKGAVDHKDVTAKNVLTDSDKELTSTLYESDLNDELDITGMDQGSKAIEDIEIELGIKFSDHAKSILLVEENETLIAKYESKEDMLSVRINSTTSKTTDPELEFHITAARPEQLVSLSLSQADLDLIGDSPVNGLNRDLNKVDAKFGTKLEERFKGEDGEFYQYQPTSHELTIEVKNIKYKYVILPAKTKRADKGILLVEPTTHTYILDVESTPSLTDSQLRDAYNKFSANIDLSTKSSPYGNIGAINHPELDVTKDHFKVMVVGTDTDHTSITFRVGLIGLDKNSGELCLSWRAASSASDISDAMTKGDVVTEILGPQLPGFGSPINAMTIGVSDTTKVSNFLKEVIKSIPAFAGKTVAI